jgi:hypothetical protein
MPYALVQQKDVAYGAIFSDGSEVCTFDGSVVSGNLVVVVVEQATNLRTVTSVSASNITFTSDAALKQALATPASLIEIWYGVATGAFTAVTVSLSSNDATNAAIKMYEFSGNTATPAPVTNKSNPTAVATSVTSASVTPATADNVVIAAFWSSGLTGGTGTGDAAFTEHWFDGTGTTAFRGAGYAIQTAATGQTWDATFSSSNENFSFVLAAFPGASAGGTVHPFVGKFGSPLIGKI